MPDRLINVGYRRISPITVPDDPAVLAYTAGLVDGEGHIGVTAAFEKATSVNVSHSIKVTIVNTNRQMLDWLVTNFGAIIHTRTGRHREWKQSLEWSLFGLNAERFLKAILPYLVIKKEQALLVIELRKLSARRGMVLSEDTVAKRSDIKERLHALNQRGTAVA